MKRIIYRVDDRFIHGQVIEGWINYYRIPNIILVNDRIAEDNCQRLIYESIMPIGSKLFITTVADFLEKQPYKNFKRGNVLIILGSVKDMYSIRYLPDNDSYINIGCITANGNNIEISETVYVDIEQLNMLKQMSLYHDIFVHQVPWDNPLDIKRFDLYKRLESK